MHKYETYQKTDIPWMPTVPSGWELKKGKNLFNNKKEINKNNAEKNIMSLTLRGVIRNNILNPIGLAPSDYSTYQIFEKDNLVFKLIDLENYQTSRVGLIEERGAMSPAYIRLIPKGNLVIKYFYYQYYDWYRRGVFNGVGNGVRSTLNSAQLLDLPIVVPSILEQEKIVAYLDYKISMIDKLIVLEEKKKEKLRNLRDSYIVRCVTKGLSSSVETIDSGIEWIGEVPKHWKVRRLGNMLTPINEINHPEMQLLSVVREKGVIIRNLDDKESNHNFIPDDLSKYKVVKKGNFAMNKMKAWQGSYGVSTYDGIVSPAYYVFEVRDIIPEYFHNAIRSKLYVAFFAQASDGVRVGQWDLSRERMKQIPFLIPPIEEQIAIGEFIKRKNLEFDEFAEAIDMKIHKLQSLKESLIYDAVTGQIDVRDFTFFEEVE